MIPDPFSLIFVQAGKWFHSSTYGQGLPSGRALLSMPKLWIQPLTLKKEMINEINCEV